ncbi:FadR/GntR family transcriptional regulator [Marinomonas communis]|uniref:GntR family transcriptional regulator n=1 Tax=Marinomonas communis TaxID=28254 RepID=A0A4R6X5E8_9GAMM|nr:FadR/GntR family transcriptional regulator [Marinomonas communis]TDR12494.1 GntR family transcriptional regulator [Marinomonas communis]
MVESTEFLGRKESLTEQLKQRIEIDIRSGYYAPGTKIPTEKKFIESYGVSRSVVREAIASLRSEGFLQAKQGVGVFVSDPLPTQPFEITPQELVLPDNMGAALDLRKAIEIEAAGLAAERHNADQLFQVEAAFENLKNAYLSEKLDVGLQDFAFHIAIAEASNCHYFVSLLIYIRDQVTNALRDKYTDPVMAPEDQRKYRESALMEHEKLLAAIRSRQSDVARELMRQHLINAKAYFEKKHSQP